MSYVDHGKQEGATVITGGKRHGDKGYFIEPVSRIPSMLSGGIVLCRTVQCRPVPEVFIDSGLRFNVTPGP